jgi:myo-inositol-1-phosphate synthase
MDQFSTEAPADTIRRLQADLTEFQKQNALETVVVVNVASTEPAADAVQLPNTWEALEQLVVRGLSLSKPDPAPSGSVATRHAAEPVAGRPQATAGALPASSLYAIAAFSSSQPYINFTPSLGATPVAIQELASLRGTCHAGQDGKTGETLLKSVLAPMFAARNLEVLSWVGHNIFGNLDGLVLDDPANKAAKIKGKDQLVSGILGYDPQTLVSIEYIRSLGDWKTAWDHIHFRGFLDTPMTLQFIWQGCDSLLAAPLVLDLVRLVELSHRRGETGLLAHLGSFFKQPLGLTEHDFSRQFSLLCDWAARQSQTGRQGDKETRR